MAFVVRRTDSPDADLARGWSAWGGIYEEHPASLPDIDNWMMGAGIEEYPEDAAECAEFINDESHLTIRRDPASGLYAVYHHAGLSAYELHAETIDEAIEEAKSGSESSRKWTWLTGGCTAIEPIRFVHVRDDIYVFECREIGAQHES